MQQRSRETLSGHRTRETVRTKLERIALRAKKDKNAKFCSLFHLMNKATLREAFRRTKAEAASGIDNETKSMYENDLENNLARLTEKLRNSSYRPQPVKRVYIPKAGSREKRPIGIPVLEDKIVQTAMVIILESIYEQDFLEMSYGFRPNKSCHKAIKDLNEKIWTKNINYIVDADIRKFFDTVDHEKLMIFLKHRILDTKILRLIQRFLKAGIVEGGKFTETTEGMPQGGTLSPLLANIYLHYALDLWFEKIVKKCSNGEAHIVRYADDSVAGFQYRKEAEKYYEALEERMKNFSLELSKEKSRILEFGKRARENAIREGKKPETFDFLGFTHYWGKSRNNRTKLKRKTASKKFRSKVNDFGKWMRENYHRPLKEIWEKVNQKLQGHYQYYGVTDNYRSLRTYRKEVLKILYKWLNRRSQRKSYTHKEFEKLIKYYPLKEPKIVINLNIANA